MKQLLLLIIFLGVAFNLSAQSLTDTVAIKELCKKMWKEWSSSRSTHAKTLYFNNKDSVEKYGISKKTAEITLISITTHINKQQAQIEDFYFLKGELFRIHIRSLKKGFIGIKEVDKVVAYYFSNGNLIYEVGKNYEKIDIGKYLAKVKQYHNKGLLILNRED